MTLSFLGVGLSFPVRINAKGGLSLSRYEEDIKEACRIILGTALGERAMRPGFGCAVYDFLFDPADASLAGKIEFFVENALKRWEPRIIVKSVTASTAKEKITVDVTYIIRRTNVETNFVFPYFKRGLP